MASSKSKPLLWLVGVIGVFLICLELWSATRSGAEGNTDIRLIRQTLAELKESQLSTKSEVQASRRAIERNLSDLKASIAQLEKTRISSQPANSVEGQRHAENPTHEAHPTEGNHSKSCSLPELAKITSMKFKQHAPCLWEPEKAEGDDCPFHVHGTCKEHFHKQTGCMFYGYPRNEQYQPKNFILPDKVEGEIYLTPEESEMLKGPFRPCHSRPRFFMASEPLMSKGKEIARIGTDREPLVLLSGGSAGIAQHFYFVLSEVGMTDSYRLGWQKPSNIDVVVDIGANVGLFSISVCKRFPQARIIAFEPHPANFRFLKYNLKAAGCEDRVETYNKGISADGRGMKIYWHDSIGTSAFRKSEHYVRMETITPEIMFQIVGGANVSLMKIDCEGCEYEVVPLLPMPRVESLFCEVHHVSLYENTLHVSGDLQKVVKDVENACKAGNKFGYFVPA